MTYKSVIKHRSIKIPGELIDNNLKGVLSNKIDMEGFEKDIKSLRKEWAL